MTDVTALGPTRPSERFDAMDVLRGFALCGILLVNILDMGTPWVRDYPLFPMDLSDWSWRVWLAEGVFLEGTMRGLFTLLFGAGVILITRKGDAAGSASSADVYIRRCMALMVLGLINYSLLVWPGDILWDYGVAGLFLFVFRRLRPPYLIAVALAILTLLTAQEGLSGLQEARDFAPAQAAAEAQARGAILTEPQRGALETYQARMDWIDPPAAEIAEEAEQKAGGYPALVAWSFTTFAEWGLSGWGMLMVAESMAFMMIGMALFRMGVLTGQKSLGFYLAATGLGYAMGVSINVWEHVQLWRAGLTPEAWGPAFTYELSRLPMTIGHLGLVMTLWKLNLLGVIGAGLRAMGRMALTNYLGQSVITTIIFYGLGWWGRLDWAELWVLAVAIWIAQALFSILWLRRFAMGPMEWLLRTVSYGRGPDLRV